MRILAVTNIYPSVQHPASGTFVEQQVQGLRRTGLDVDLMLVDRMQEGTQAYLRLSRRIRQIVADSEPDLVHTMYGGVMADIVTRTIVDRPVIVSFCGSDLLGELLSGPLRKLISLFGVWASRRTAMRAAGIVVKSKNLREALPFDVDPSRVRVIANGIDLERFRPLGRDACCQSLKWNLSSFHVLFPTNSGDPCKRPHLAKAAVEYLNQLGVHAEMHELRGVTHEEVPIWINASNVVLLTSLHEGSPNVIKEALACDVPIVSVNVGDVAERIEGVEGCYIAQPEPGDLATKLQMVHKGPRRIKGRIKIQEVSLERVSLRLKDFYEETAASFRTRKTIDA